MRIAVTLGEPAGIGPDICLALPERRDCQQVLVGSHSTLATRAESLGLACPPLRSVAPEAAVVVEPIDTPRPVAAGRLDPVNARAVLDTLDHALLGCRRGDYAAMVTAPVHKGVINDAGVAFTGHTEYLAEACGADPVMLLAAGDLRVALVTTHLPLARVADAITAAAVQAATRTLHDALRRRYGIPSPHILVLGLNPHAGEGGHLGREEIEVITPALEALRDEGLRLSGPLPADTAFTPHHLPDADAVLAMYHDQGLPVLKYAGFGQAVNVTLGLPIIRTSVDHGTALELAGTGRANHLSLVAAVEEACRLSRHTAP
ncbi:MAG: 4-hydroxythreonine-4-phosphate dehydrogenase PdxA [Pseudomonadota bacterium]